MELWQERFKELNTNTVELSILGDRILFTDDPENIKAMLALQFGDYGMAFNCFFSLDIACRYYFGKYCGCFSKYRFTSAIC